MGPSKHTKTFFRICFYSLLSTFLKHAGSIISRFGKKELSDIIKLFDFYSKSSQNQRYTGFVFNVNSKPRFSEGQIIQNATKMFLKKYLEEKNS